MSVFQLQVHFRPVVDKDDVKWCRSSVINLVSPRAAESAVLNNYAQIAAQLDGIMGSGSGSGRFVLDVRLYNLLGLVKAAMQCNHGPYV